MLELRTTTFILLTHGTTVPRMNGFLSPHRFIFCMNQLRAVSTSTTGKHETRRVCNVCRLIAVVMISLSQGALLDF
jgi:hypothetical protein